MSDTIAELRAFAAHPKVDSMEPVYPLTQDKAREILRLFDALPDKSLSFKQIKEAARRNGVDADALGEN